MLNFLVLHSYSTFNIVYWNPVAQHSHYTVFFRVQR